MPGQNRRRMTNIARFNLFPAAASDVPVSGRGA
jgi:hypothetical protein